MGILRGTPHGSRVPDTKILWNHGAWRWTRFWIPSEKVWIPFPLSLPAFFVVFGQVLILGSHLQPIKRSNVCRWWIEAFENVLQFTAHFPIENPDPAWFWDGWLVCLCWNARGGCWDGALSFRLVHPRDGHAQCLRWHQCFPVEMKEEPRLPPSCTISRPICRRRRGLYWGCGTLLVLWAGRLDSLPSSASSLSYRQWSLNVHYSSQLQDGKVSP